MRAAWYERNGEARDVLIVGEMATPEPGPGEVLVQVNTTGVNPSDVKSRRGRPLGGSRVIPHSDGGGIIEAAGAGVPSSRIGERVWLWNAQWKRPFGTAAEYIALPSAQAVRLPDEVDFLSAACFGIPALTAIHAVLRLGDIAGKTILVTGGGSAVGHSVTQIAVWKGARVIATASADKRAHAQSAGAGDVIDYKAEDVAECVKSLTGGNGVDAIVDMDLSSTVPLLSAGVLAAHGTLVTYGSNVSDNITLSFRVLAFNALTIESFLVYELLPEQRKIAEAELAALIRAGRLTYPIAATFALDHIAAAHEMVEAGRVTGNVVIAVD